jgi:uncharacterized protein YdhG (YjbR/CyaY superfamily)
LPADEVDAWFEKYDNPMKPVVQAIRRVILETDPRMEEVIKWQAPTFVYKGNLASFYPKSRQHASLMFHLGARIPGDFSPLEGTGDTSRVMKFTDLADVERKKDELQRIVRAWIEMKS